MNAFSPIVVVCVERIIVSNAVTLSNDNVFEIVTKADGIYLKLKDKATMELDGENKASVVITLRSKTTDDAGKLVSVQTTVYVQFL